MRPELTKRSFGKSALGLSAALHGGVLAAVIGLSLPGEPASEVVGIEIITVSPEVADLQNPTQPLGQSLPIDGVDSIKSVPSADHASPAVAPPQIAADPDALPQSAAPQPAPSPPATASLPAPAPGGVTAVPAPGKGVTLLFGEPPPYPPGARREGLEGRVVIRVTLSGEGAPARLRLAQSSGYPVLDKAALEAVAKWRFRATGTVEIDVPIQFKLEDANR